MTVSVSHTPPNVLDAENRSLQQTLSSRFSRDKLMGSFSNSKSGSKNNDFIQNQISAPQPGNQMLSTQSSSSASGCKRTLFLQQAGDANLNPSSIQREVVTVNDDPKSVHREQILRRESFNLINVSDVDLNDLSVPGPSSCKNNNLNSILTFQMNMNDNCIDSMSSPRPNAPTLHRNSIIWQGNNYTNDDPKSVHREQILRRESFNLINVSDVDLNDLSVPGPSSCKNNNLNSILTFQMNMNDNCIDSMSSPRPNAPTLHRNSIIWQGNNYTNERFEDRGTDNTNESGIIDESRSDSDGLSLHFSDSEGLSDGDMHSESASELMSDEENHNLQSPRVNDMRTYETANTDIQIKDDTSMRLDSIQGSATSVSLFRPKKRGNKGKGLTLKKTLSNSVSGPGSAVSNKGTLSKFKGSTQSQNFGENNNLSKRAQLKKSRNLLPQKRERRASVLESDANQLFKEYSGPRSSPRFKRFSTKRNPNFNPNEMELDCDENNPNTKGRHRRRSTIEHEVLRGLGNNNSASRKQSNSRSARSNAKRADSAGRSRWVTSKAKASLRMASSSRDYTLSQNQQGEQSLKSLRHQLLEDVESSNSSHQKGRKAGKEKSSAAQKIGNLGETNASNLLSSASSEWSSRSCSASGSGKLANSSGISSNINDCSFSFCGSLGPISSKITFTNVDPDENEGLQGNGSLFDNISIGPKQSSTMSIDSDAISPRKVSKQHADCSEEGLNYKPNRSSSFQRTAQRNNYKNNFIDKFRFNAEERSDSPIENMMKENYSRKSVIPSRAINIQPPKLDDFAKSSPNEANIIDKNSFTCPRKSIEGPTNDSTRQLNLLNPSYQSSFGTFNVDLQPAAFRASPVANFSEQIGYQVPKPTPDLDQCTDNEMNENEDHYLRNDNEDPAPPTFGLSNENDENSFNRGILDSTAAIKAGTSDNASHTLKTPTFAMSEGLSLNPPSTDLNKARVSIPLLGSDVSDISPFLNRGNAAAGRNSTVSFGDNGFEFDDLDELNLIGLDEENAGDINTDEAQNAGDFSRKKKISNCSNGSNKSNQSNRSSQGRSKSNSPTKLTNDAITAGLCSVGANGKKLIRRKSDTNTTVKGRNSNENSGMNFTKALLSNSSAAAASSSSSSSSSSCSKLNVKVPISSSILTGKSSKSVENESCTSTRGRSVTIQAANSTTDDKFISLKSSEIANSKTKIDIDITGAGAGGGTTKAPTRKRRDKRRRSMSAGERGDHSHSMSNRYQTSGGSPSEMDDLEGLSIPGLKRMRFSSKESLLDLKLPRLSTAKVRFSSKVSGSLSNDSTLLKDSVNYTEKSEKSTQSAPGFPISGDGSRMLRNGDLKKRKRASLSRSDGDVTEQIFSGHLDSIKNKSETQCENTDMDSYADSYAEPAPNVPPSSSFRDCVSHFSGVGTYTMCTAKTQASLYALRRTMSHSESTTTTGSTTISTVGNHNIQQQGLNSKLGLNLKCMSSKIKENASGTASSSSSDCKVPVVLNLSDLVSPDTSDFSFATRKTSKDGLKRRRLKRELGLGTLGSTGNIVIDSTPQIRLNNPSLGEALAESASVVSLRDISCIHEIASEGGRDFEFDIESLAGPGGIRSGRVSLDNGGGGPSNNSSSQGNNQQNVNTIPGILSSSSCDSSMTLLSNGNKLQLPMQMDHFNFNAPTLQASMTTAGYQTPRFTVKHMIRPVSSSSPPMHETKSRVSQFAAPIKAVSNFQPNNGSISNNVNSSDFGYKNVGDPNRHKINASSSEQNININSNNFDAQGTCTSKFNNVCASGICGQFPGNNINGGNNVNSCENGYRIDVENLVDSADRDPAHDSREEDRLFNLQLSGVESDDLDVSKIPFLHREKSEPRGPQQLEHDTSIASAISDGEKGIHWTGGNRETRLALRQIRTNEDDFGEGGETQTDCITITDTVLVEGQHGETRTSSGSGSRSRRKSSLVLPPVFDPHSNSLNSAVVEANTSAKSNDQVQSNSETAAPGPGPTTRRRNMTSLMTLSAKKHGTRNANNNSSGFSSATEIKNSILDYLDSFSMQSLEDLLPPKLLQNEPVLGEKIFRDIQELGQDMRTGELGFNFSIQNVRTFRRRVTSIFIENLEGYENMEAHSNEIYVSQVCQTFLDGALAGSEEI